MIIGESCLDKVATAFETGWKDTEIFCYFYDTVERKMSAKVSDVILTEKADIMNV